MEAPAELLRGGRERRARRQRLAERVDGAEPLRDRAALRGLRDREREEDRHRPAEAVPGDVERLHRVIHAGGGIEERAALERRAELLEDGPARRAHVAVEPRRDAEPLAPDRHRGGADVRVAEPVPEVRRLRAAVAEDHDAPAPALEKIRGREDEHRVDDLRHPHARALFEPYPARDRHDRVEVRVRVPRAAAEGVGEDLVARRVRRRVGGEEPLDEAFVDGERRQTRRPAGSLDSHVSPPQTDSMPGQRSIHVRRRAASRHCGSSGSIRSEPPAISSRRASRAPATVSSSTTSRSSSSQ